MMQSKTRTVFQTLSVVIMMGGLAWASVPFYDWFCRVTGFGGTPNIATAGSAAILDQTITVRFDASLERGMPWEFRPSEREMKLRIGEVGLTFFEAFNPTNEAVAGTASFNVVPYAAGEFFSKIECFCFEEQVLGPNERIAMPVTFYIDPDIVTDRDARFVHTVTLSYTFHKINSPVVDSVAAVVARPDSKS